MTNNKFILCKPDSETIHQAFENGEEAVIALFITQAKMFENRLLEFKNTLKELDQRLKVLEEKAALVKGLNDAVDTNNPGID